MSTVPPLDATWTREPTNPIIEDTDAWEQGSVQNIERILPGSPWSAWYIGGWDNPALGRMTSADGIAWTKDPANPILGQGAGGLAGPLTCPFIEEFAGTLYLYASKGGSGFSDFAIFTSSDDGDTWTQQADSISLPSGATLWGHRVVWKEGASWKMLQEAGPVPWRIYLYTSSDGLTWSLANGGLPLSSLARHPAGAYGGPRFASLEGVVTPRFGGLYHLWYHAASIAGGTPTEIYHASSSDLINWTVSPPTPVLTHSGVGFESVRIAEFYPLVVGSTAYLFYDGVNDAGESAATGVAYGVPVEAPDAIAWDVYASDDLNGPIIATLTDTVAREFRKELRGPGSGAIKLNRHNAIATEAILAEGNLVRCRIPEHGPAYLFSWFIGPGDHTILSPQDHIGGEILGLSGPGGITYLDRARMTRCAFSLEGTTATTWTEIWETSAVSKPVGLAYDPDEPDYVYVIHGTTHKVKKIDQSTRLVVASSPALWTGTGKNAAGLAFDPADDTIAWALEAPWLSGSSANTKIRKVRRSDWAILDTFDLGSPVHLTDIHASSGHLWTSRYDTDTIQKRSKSTGSVVDSSTITYNGTVQRKPNGIAMNGTKIAYWFGGDSGGGTGRALIADVSNPWVITDVQKTTGVSAFGGEWTTEGGEDFLYAESVTLGKIWKYQLTATEPPCADADGYLTPEQTTPGAIANRVLLEITHVDRPDEPCPDLTWDFTATLDSNGDPWLTSAATEIFRWRVGERGYSDVLMRLIPYGIDFEMDPNQMILHAYNAKGVDRTGGEFAGGVVRFVEGEGSNITGELRRRADAPPVDTHMTAKGDGKKYGSATLLDRPYVREGYIEVPGVTDTTILNARAAADLARQRLIADAIAIPHSWIDDEANGGYLAGKHYDTGDLVTVHSGADDWDYDESDWRVYAFTVAELSGGGWSQLPEMGSAYRIDTSTGSLGGGGAGGGGSVGGGGSGGGTIAASLTVQSSDGEVVVAGVKTIIADGVTSTEPGVAVLPSASTGTDENIEDLPTAETDTTLVYSPDGSGGVVARPDTTGIEIPVDHGALGSAETFDHADGHYHYGTLDDDCDIDLDGAINDELAWMSLELLEDGTGGHTPSWPGSIVWTNGATPVHDTTAGAITVYEFWSRDGGITWFGTAGGGAGTGVTYGTPAIVLGTAAAAGSTDEAIRRDATIVAFDATVPVTQAYGDTAATGAAAVAARRDHRHGMPAGAVTAADVAALGFVGPILMADGITNPPEPLWSDDGTDYLYADLG